METFSALLAICAGNLPVPGEFPAQRPVARSFEVFLDLRLNKRLCKQSWGWWFEMLSRSLWRHRNDRGQKPIHLPQQHACCCFDDAKSQGISSHCIDLAFIEYSNFIIRNVNALRSKQQWSIFCRLCNNCNFFEKYFFNFLSKFKSEVYSSRPHRKQGSRKWLDAKLVPSHHLGQ